jgi:hypothetical protein
MMEHPAALLDRLDQHEDNVNLYKSNYVFQVVLMRQLNFSGVNLQASSVNLKDF